MQTANFPLLSLVTFLPLLGAFFIMLIPQHGAEADKNARFAALWTALITLVLAIFVWTGFDPAGAGFQMVEYHVWMPSFEIAYHLGVDGVSVAFVLLSAFLMPLCILASWNTVKTHVREYMIAFLILETMMIGVFCALDFLLFYIFFEGVLIPMFLIIGIWGGVNRVYAAFKLFLYTLLGSVLMLVALLVVLFQAGTSSIPELLQTVPFTPAMQGWLWLAFFASFAVKIPMWPVHTWLPDAHVQAPTAGSVILAGVLLKMGGYGYYRFSLPLLPEANEFFAPMVFGLSVIAIIYASLVALVQEDIKKLIAYSSVAHMGFVTLGLFSRTTEGVEGAIFQMISHGLVSGALFLMVGVLYDRLHTRNMSDFGGICQKMPMFSKLVLVLVMASAGLPGTSGFIGEFLSLFGTFKVSAGFTALAATGLVLGAAYSLLMYKRSFLGQVTNDHVAELKDIGLKEYVLFVPLVILILWLGIFPDTLLNVIAPSVDAVVNASHQGSVSNTIQEGGL